MDVGSLLSGTKWQLVELIAQSPKSPNDLAKQLNTSIANVSIQLRTLELASIVSKTRVARPIAGGPRVFYSLKKNIMFVLNASKTVQYKRPLVVSPQKEFILAVWQLPENLQQPILTLYYTHPQLFLDAANLAINPANSSDMSIQLLISGVKSGPKPVTLEIAGKKVVFSFTVSTQFPEDAVVLRQGGDSK